ncbi:MAG TPA: hypothetical protein VF503_03200 [Sphingobium sp.]|uniref:hypothetical protein n=1 Tax=Sphingobium sp. TaxID=1912891 RepID=UPI002ED4E010
MDGTTVDDRKKELKVLLQQMQEQPSRDWSEQRQRAAILTEMIAAGERGEGQAQQQG